MKKIVVAALVGALSLPLAAQSPGAWAGYSTYSPPVAVAGSLSNEDQMWLEDVARLVGPDGFTFLGRRDADHWLALTNQGTSWLLQIHDETARFNFRAMVSPITGRMTVWRGVDWVGTGRAADAAKAAALARDYVTRARFQQGVFAPTPAALATGADHPAPAHAPTEAHPASAPAVDHSTMDHATVDHSPAVAPAAAGSTGHAPAAASDHSASSHAAASSEAAPTAQGQALWRKLVDGNLRFVSGKVTRPNQSMARVEETAKGQHPFAIVVSCSDSRVPPEVLFDQGIGDLFVVRTAGEVVTEVELGSIEYAVEHLGATYLVVLGHKKCGAVDATVKGGDLPPNIEAIAAQIRPAVEAARFFKGDTLDNAVRENAKQVLAKIKGSKILGEAIHAGHLDLVAAYYDIDTGKVAALP